jgi:transcriptional regulator with XRE-family HTH domain
MVSFNQKPITNPLSLGEKLATVRGRQGLTILDITTKTGIAEKYIKALESGDYHHLPGTVYAKSFLRSYAKLLGLSVKEVINQYISEQTIYEKTKKNFSIDFQKPVARISKLNLLATPKLIKGSVVVGLALLCLIYLGTRVNAILTPPVLVVQQPVENLVLNESFIEVVGYAEKESVLEINGQQILTDSNGNFSEVIDLQRGVNVIEVKAEKRHGRQSKVYRQVVVDEKTAQAQNNFTN